MLLLYCLAVFTLLFLYYFYIPENNTSGTIINKYNELFRVDSKFKNQIKFVSVNGKINRLEACSNQISLRYKLTKKISSLYDLIWPLMKYLGVSVDEEAARYRILNNGNELRFVCTQFSKRIHANYKTLSELLVDLNQQGFTHDSIKAVNVLIGVDFTASNEWKGRKTFFSQSLHKISRIHNPYQKAIVHLTTATSKLIAESLGTGDFLRMQAFGFGDSLAKDTSVFSMLDQTESPSNILDTILSSYANIAKKVDLSGPSSYAPIVHQAIKQINKSKQTGFEMSILAIFSDGELTHENIYETMQAFIDASSHALSIIIIGVGDGPWANLQQLEKYLCNKSKFDNLNFVDYNQFLAANSKCLDSEFCLKLFSKLPRQFGIIKQLNYI